MNEHPSDRLPTDKRARLFKAAGAEFTQHGFSQASLNRIIASVGMSKSSFYHYFENKTDLFRQILDQTMAPILAALKDFDVDALSDETFWPSIQFMTRQMAEMANASPETVMVGRMFYQSRETSEDQELTRDILDVSMNWTSKLLHRGQALGLVRSDLPESFLVDAVMSLGMAMDRWILAHWDELSDAERLKLNGQIFDVFVRLLAPGDV